VLSKNKGRNGVNYGICFDISATCAISKEVIIAANVKNILAFEMLNKTSTHAFWKTNMHVV
jgi:hypothetical protein